MNLYDATAVSVNGKTATKLTIDETIVWQRLPTGYTEVRYIQSTGTQYIDTGVISKIGYTAEIGFQCTNTAEAEKWVLGLYQTWNIYWRAGLYYNAGLDYSPWGFTYDQTEDYYAYTVATGNMAMDSSMPMYMFGQNDRGSPSGLSGNFKVYYCKIWDADGNLVFDVVPCINPDSEVGMYDFVSATFFANSGTGAFIASEE